MRLHVLERMVTLNYPERTEKVYKAPTFDGRDDVEHFVLRFTEVNSASNRKECAALLHLREALREDTQGCG